MTTTGNVEALRRHATGAEDPESEHQSPTNGYHLGYLPIEHYGLIGNMRTCALVGIDGSLDFMCWYVLNLLPSSVSTGNYLPTPN
jgi:hypothetical protein